MSTPLVVGRDHYMSRVKSWRSLLSTYVVVGTTVGSLNELLLGIGPFVYTHPTAPGVALVGADGVEDEFSGNLFTEGEAPANVDTSYTLKIVPTSVIMAFSDGDAWSETVTDDGSGVLAGDAGTPAAGTIDYDTGAWTLTFDTVPTEGAYFDLQMAVAYQFAEGDIQGLWMTPAGDMYASFDGATDPDQANSRGILISESILLSAQPQLIYNMKLQASADTELWIEILV